MNVNGELMMRTHKQRGTPAPVLMPGTRLRVALPWTVWVFIAGLYLATAAAALFIRAEIQSAVHAAVEQVQTSGQR